MSNDLFPPPRRIPLNIKAKCLFRGLRYQISWLFLAFAFVFFLVFAFDYSSILFSSSEIETTSGTLIHSEKTIFSTATFSLQSGFLHDRGERIYKYSYRYKARGESYKGSSVGIDKQVDKEVPQVVEYLENKPSISRIQGMSPGLHLRGGITSIVLILVIILVAFSAVYSMTWKRIRLYRLLKDGLTAIGAVKSKHLLSRSSGREWYEVVYEFVVNGSCYQIKNRPYYTERIEIGVQRTLLYDRKKPHKAALLDNIPCAIIVDESGQIRSGSILSTVTVSLIPIASMIFMITLVYFEFFK